MRFAPTNLGRVRGYRRSDLRRDVLAGMVLSAFLVPVGMAYAQAAGLPPVHGLYATAVPMLVYALLGPSRLLVLGPDSTLAPLIAATVLPLAAGDSAKAVALASVLAIGAGALALAAGFAGLGLVTELFSVPARYGYLNGIAVVVIISQLPKLLGIPASSDRTIGVLGDLASGLPDLDPWATVIGVSSLLALVALGRWAPKVPAVLVVVAVSTAAVRILGLEGELSLVGDLPPGVPELVVPTVSTGDLGALAFGAVAVALVSFADTSVLSQSFATRTGDRVDPNRELVALGASNMACGLFQGFPVSASSSRTPIAESAGAQSQMSGVVGALTVVLLLVAAPGITSTLPDAALAAVVIVAVTRLIEVKGVARLWSTHRREFALSVAGFIGVVVAGVQWGIGLAVVLSLVVFVQQAWRPHTTALVRLDGVKGYHDAHRHPEGRSVPRLLLYRFDAPLFFANAEVFRSELLAQLDAAGPDVSRVVVTAEPITDIDATADLMLRLLCRELADRGVELAFAELKGVVRDGLERSGTAQIIGADRFYPTVGRAVRSHVQASGVGWVDWSDG